MSERGGAALAAPLDVAEPACRQAAITRELLKRIAARPTGTRLRLELATLAGIRDTRRSAWVTCLARQPGVHPAASVRRALERLAAAASKPPGTPRTEPAGSRWRSSPKAHWRHVTRGAIFDANPRRREWIAGVGWCVRIRVDPRRRRSGREQHREREGGEQRNHSLPPGSGWDAPRARDEPNPATREGAQSGTPEGVIASVTRWAT
jgi:hypothetical protein